MSIEALQPAGAGPSFSEQAYGAGRAASATSLFGSRLDQAQRDASDPDAELRELTEMVVSTAFIAPMFEQLRSDPLAANLFHGGRAESIFQQQLDQVLSDRIATTTKFGLADALFKQFKQSSTGNTLNLHG